MRLLLRQKLLMRVVPAITVVQILSGTLLNKFVSDRLRDRFDMQLLERATLLTAEVENRPGGIVTDLAEYDPAKRPESTEIEFVQVLGPSGTVHFLSALRRGKVLAAPSPHAGQVEYSSLVLENDRKLRCVHLGFHPEVDEEAAESDSQSIRHDPRTTLTMTVGRETTALQHDLNYFHLLLVLAVSTTILVLIIALLALIRTTLKPVETLAAQIARLDPTHPDRVHLDSKVPVDFQPIVTRLNDLMGKVQRTLEREQTFTADFAHEMRTPIAGLRSTLEVSLTKDRSTSEYRDSLLECLDMAKGLQTLTETMLMLRRLESGSAQPRTERFLLGTLVAEIIDSLAEAARARDMTIDSKIDPALYLRTDRSLLELAIRNLVENAVAHGQPGGIFTIRGANSSAGTHLEFRNPGGPSDQEEAMALRDRFRRGDTSRDATDGHFGLGLALVDAIAQVLGFRVDVKLSSAREFAVHLWFTTDVHNPREL